MKGNTIIRQHVGRSPHEEKKAAELFEDLNAYKD